MSGLLSQKSLILVRSKPFTIAFKRHNTLSSTDVEGGNEGISSVGGIKNFVVMSTDLLKEQVKGDETFDFVLRCTLLKILGSRKEQTSDYVALNWKMDFVSATSATVKLDVRGAFIKNLLMNYKEPVKIRITMEVELENRYNFPIISNEMSPSAIFYKKQGQASFSFMDELKVETNETISVDKTYSGMMTMEMVVIRRVVLTGLPSKIAMGQDILENKIQWDFEVIAENDTRFECHKVFLACNSKPLACMLQTDCKESKEKFIKLKLSAEAVSAFLKFIYYSNVDVPMESPNIALELLEFGHMYEVLGMEKAMRNLILSHQTEWLDIDTAILLYLYTRKLCGNEDLKLMALNTFKSKADDLKTSHVFKKFLTEDTNAATQLIALALKI